MVLSSAFRDSKLLSTGDVARELRVHRSTVWLWIRSGILPSEKSGHFYGVRENALTEFRSRYDVSTPRKSKK